MDLLDHVEAYAKTCRGNWMKFNSFNWHDKPEDAENWFHLTIGSRDADLLTRCNREVILREMRKIGGEDWREETHSHWACGYVEIITVRCVNKAHSINDSLGKFGLRCEPEPDKYTTAFVKICELMMRMEEYPILDESLYSEMEYDETDNEDEDSEVEES